MKYIHVITGSPGPTERVAASDAAQQFTDDQVISGSKVALGAIITCEDNNIRFALGGATPTQGAGASGHILYSGQSLHLSSPAAVRSFSFINATNGSDAVLQVTFEFQPGA